MQVQPSFTTAERLALAGFLAGHRGLTRDAYTLDLRQFSGMRLPWTVTSSVPSWSRPGSARPASMPSSHCSRERAACVRGHWRGHRAHPGLERGHRTLIVTRKGGKVVTIPLVPCTVRAIDLATSERTEVPLFVTADGRRLDRHGAARTVRRVTRRAGIARHVSPHTLRHAFITAALDAGVPLRDVQEAAPSR